MHAGFIINIVAKRRAKGPSYPVTEEWSRAALARAAEIGVTRGAIAKQLGVSYATIHNLFSGVGSYSEYIPQVHKILGWPPPAPVLISKDSLELTAIYKRLTPDQRELLYKLAIEYDSLNDKSGDR